MPDRRRDPLGLLLADRALLIALAALRAALRVWPMSWRIRWGGWLGRAAAGFSKRRTIAVNNLKRAFRDDPDADRERFERIVSDSHRDFGRSLVEFLMSPGIGRAYFDAHVEVDGEERLRELVRRGRGAVLLTGHFGNWEWLNLMAGAHGYPLAVLVKPQKLPRSDAYMNRLRARNGARVVLRGMDLRRAYRTLEAGGLVGILADQDGGPKGIFVPLFGRASSYPRGVARFAYAASAPALPVFCARVAPDRHRIHIGKPVWVGEGESETDFENRVVRAFSEELEAMIRRYPSQWMWSHRRWKSSPDRDILVLDDGRKGHVNQSLALAARVAERRAADARTDTAGPAPQTRIRTERVEFRSAAARAALTLWGMVTRGGLWGGRFLLRWTLTRASYRRLMTAPADTVISCGTITEAVNLILARDCRAKSCYIQKPQFGTRHFSAVLIPVHDRPAPGRNLLQTGGALSAVSQARLERLRDRARSEAGIPAGAPAVAVLVGGPSKHAPWDAQELERVFLSLRDLSREHKLYLLLTTSRRTDAAVESLIERIFTGEPRCPVVVLAARSNPSGAYEGLLAAADRVLVTADSVSMISEAVGTGKPVGLISPGGEGSERGKFARFIRNLEREGSAVRVRSGRLKDFLTRVPSDAPRSGSGAGFTEDAAGLAAGRLAG